MEKAARRPLSVLLAAAQDRELEVRELALRGLFQDADAVLVARALAVEELARFVELTGLRALLLQKPDQFPMTLTEKLLAYAMGRRLEYYDRPAVRQIVREAGAQQYRWSSLILGIVKSPTFQTRGAP